MVRLAVDRPRPSPPPAVSVNGVIIDRAAIAREAQYHPAAKPSEAWRAAARALVVRELLLQRARQLGIEARPAADAAGRRLAEDEAVIAALIEREIKTPEPDEEACQRYYLNNQHRFRSPTIYEASHILFAARRENAQAFERARQEAIAVLCELKDRPGRFAELARRHSDCPSAADGGSLGQITAGQTTPEFEQALARLAPGAITEQPVETRYGLHIIRLGRVIGGEVLPFEAVAGRIADYLRDSAARRAQAQYIARLAAAADITGVVLPDTSAAVSTTGGHLCE